jgi:integrase-like protein
MAKNNRDAPLLEEFKESLQAAGNTKSSVKMYTYWAKRFLTHVGGKPINQVTEAEVENLFVTLRNLNKASRRTAISSVSKFIKFAAAGLPVVMGKGGELPPAPAPKNKKALALRDKWAIEKLAEEKQKADDLITALTRRVIDHYLYFGKRLKGEPDDLDELARFADDCREIIERNLQLFVGLSAGGRNLHPKIDERVQR